MRKKLLLVLFLMTATVFTGFAQTDNYTVKPSDEGTTDVEINDSVTYDEQDILGLLNLGITDLNLIVEIECTSAPFGVDKDHYTQRTVLTLSLLTDILDALLGGNPLAGLVGFDDQVFGQAVGVYEFRLTRFNLITVAGNEVIINLQALKEFNINVVAEGTLSLKNVENTPEFSVLSQDGIVTINNANHTAVTGMTVYSISGAQVYKSNKAVGSIDLSAVANGVYILKVEEGAAVTTKKFIKS